MAYRNAGQFCSDQRSDGGRQYLRALGRLRADPSDFALFVEIRRDQPLVRRQRVARRVEGLQPLNDGQRAVHPEPQALEHGGELQGIDQLPVDRGLPTHGLESGAEEEEGALQGMEDERLIEAGDGGRGSGQRSGECRSGRPSRSRASRRIMP